MYMQEFLRGVGRRMKPGGTFFVVDAFRRPGVGTVTLAP
jgi:predicted methyltransferase